MKRSRYGTNVQRPRKSGVGDRTLTRHIKEEVMVEIVVAWFTALALFGGLSAALSWAVAFRPVPIPVRV